MPTLPPTLTFADELDCPLTFVLSTTESYKSTTYQPGTFTPDSNVGSGDDWTLNFTVTNKGEEAITISDITPGVFSFTSGGASQGDNTSRPIILSLSGDITGETNYTTKGTSATAGSLAPVKLTLDSDVDIDAGKSISFALNVKENNTESTYIGLASATVAIIPEPATATLSLMALCGLAVRHRRR